MSWPLRLSRFIHGLPRFGELRRSRRAPAGRRRIGAAQHFTDGFVKHATVALRNCKLTLAPMPVVSAHEVSHA